MTQRSRWLAYVLAGALLLVGVAAVAYAVGVANRSSHAAPAAQASSIPGNQGVGPGGFGQGGFGPGGNRGPATAVTVQPSVVSGTVASKTSTAIVVTTAAGKTVTVNVSSSTKYSVRGVSSATLDSVAVGYTIQAQGTLNADGSLTATVVQAAPNGRSGFPGSGGRGFPGFGGGQTPTPSASPSAPSI
jgi:hypothetical protein